MGRSTQVLRPPSAVSGAPSPSASTGSAVRRWWRRSTNLRPYGLAAPAIMILVVFFVLPVCLLAVISFFPTSPMTGMRTGFAPENYRYFWKESYFLKATTRTFEYAILATIFTALISYPLSLWLVGRSRKVRVTVALIVVMPIFITVVERSLGWMAILGTNGMLDSILQSFGATMPRLLYTGTAVVIGLTNTLLPFMFLSVFASVRRLDPSIPAAASTLGASPMRVFWRITLPMTSSGLTAGTALVFSLASSNVVTTSLLGGGETTTIPVLLYEQATVVVDYPLSAVLAVSLCVIIIVVMNLILRLTRKGGGEQAVVVPQ